MRPTSVSVARRVALIALLAALSMVLPSGAPAVGAEPVTIETFVGECGVWGDGPADEVIRLIHLGRSGRTLGSANVQVSDEGQWFRRCLPGGALKTGHRIVVRNGQGGFIRSFVMPPFGFHVDRATDVLRVSGPPSADMHFVLDACFPGRITCNGAAVDMGLSTDAKGKARADLAVDVRGDDRATIEWSDPGTGDVLRRRLDVPYLQVERGSARVKGSARPGSTVHVRLTRADKTLRGTAVDVADATGAWSKRMRRNGREVKVATGNRVIGDHASDGRLVVTPTGLVVDLASDTAHGTCIPEGRFGVRISFPGSDTSQIEYGTIGPAGTFDMPIAAVVDSGWTVHLWCATRRGDIIYRRSVIP